MSSTRVQNKKILTPKAARTQVVGYEITLEDASVLLVRYDASSGYLYQPSLLLLKGDGLPVPLRREASRELNTECTDTTQVL
jgi:hypothetical protein